MISPSVSKGHLDALLRGLVLGKLGKAGHKPTLEEARRRFKDHVEGKNTLSADLRSPVSSPFMYNYDLGFSLRGLCVSLIQLSE